MDLYIETLTGTAFELRVSPFDTIMSIKAKIQRLEGEYQLGRWGKECCLITRLISLKSVHRRCMLGNCFKK